MSFLLFADFTTAKNNKRNQVSLHLIPLLSSHQRVLVQSWSNPFGGYDEAVSSFAELTLSVRSNL